MEEGWLWPLETIATLVPPALAGSAPEQIPEVGYTHPDYDPDEYADHSERVRVHWRVDVTGPTDEVSLTVSERDEDRPLDASSFEWNAELYDDAEMFIVRRIPAERRAVFGEWAYLLEHLDGAVPGQRAWSLTGDRLHYQCHYPVGAVPEAQLYESAAKALALVEHPPGERVRPVIVYPEPSDYEWR